MDMMLKPILQYTEKNRKLLPPAFIYICFKMLSLQQYISSA